MSIYDLETALLITGSGMGRAEPALQEKFDRHVLHLTGREVISL